MRKSLFAIVTGFAALTATAQPLTQLKAVTDSFPHVSFVIRNRQPDKSVTSRLGLTENGKTLTYKLAPWKDDRKPGGRDVLILFENSHWPEFTTQRDYFRKLLEKAVDIGSGDRYFLATFDWTRSDGSVLQFADSAAISGNEAFAEALKQIQSPPRDSRIHHSTEIFQALSEGIQFLARRRGANAPALLLLSAEFSNVFNDKFDDEEIVVASRRADIPVYTVRYPRMGGKYSLNRVAAETYGLHAEANTEKPEQTSGLLRDMLKSIPERALGQVMLLSATVATPADGQAHSLDLVLNGAETYKLEYTAPGALAGWLRKPLNLVLFIAAIVAAAAAVVWLLMKQRKARQQAGMEQRDRLEAARREAADALQAQEQRFRQSLDEKEKLEAEKRRQQEEAEFQAAKAARLRYLPRYPVLTDKDGHRFELNSVTVRMGREAASNEVVIDLPSVSRRHAAIGFEHGAGLSGPSMDGRFYLWDMGSTNGTYLNEALLPKPGEPGYGPRELKNNDIVRLGAVSFVFNM